MFVGQFDWFLNKLCLSVSKTNEKCVCDKKNYKINIEDWRILDRNRRNCNVKKKVSLFFLYLRNNFLKSTLGPMKNANFNSEKLNLIFFIEEETFHL